MEINVYEMKTNNPMKLVGLGDIHVGNINCDKAKFVEIVDWIAVQPNCYWIGMGDYADSIVPSPTERRFDFKSIDRDLMQPDEQYGFIEKHFRKIKGTCLGLHTGNHDDILRQRHYNDWVEVLCKKLEVPYLGWAADTTLKFPNGKQVKIHSFHGDYGGRRVGGALNRLEDIAQSFDADIFMMGHVHHILGYRGIKFTENLQYRKVVYVLTGGFLHAYKKGTFSYLEKKARNPTKIGIAVIDINPSRNDNEQPDIHVSG